MRTLENSILNFRDCYKRLIYQGYSPQRAVHACERQRYHPWHAGYINGATAYFIGGEPAAVAQNT